MNKLTALLLIFLYPAIGWSQESPKSRNIILDFSLNASFPVGKNYSAVDLNARDSKAGYASTGIAFQATVAFMGKSSFGIGVSYIFQNNNLLDTANHILVMDDSSHFLGPGSWSNHYLMGGVCFYRQSGPFFYNAQLMGGFIFAFSPVYQLKNPETMNVDAGVGVGLAAGGSAGFGYMINERMAVRINVGYLAGFPSKTKDYSARLIGYDLITGEAIYSAPVSYEIKKVVTTLNLGAGLVFKL